MHQKSCKSAKNRQENFIHTLFCNLDPSEHTDFTENCTRGTSFAHARAFQQRFSFLLSQVSHTSSKTLIYFEKNDYSQPLHHHLFSTLFSLFQLSKSKQTLIKFHIPLYFNLLREPLWHLWQQKHKNSCLRVYVRVREKLLAPIISHFSTPYFHSPSSLIKFPSPQPSFSPLLDAFSSIFRLSTKRRLVFHKTTACFS